MRAAAKRGVFVANCPGRNAAAVAEMLGSGITCFADRYYFPDETARVASELGMRAVIGMPVAETPSSWAKSSAEYLTRALRVRTGAAR